MNMYHTINSVGDYLANTAFSVMFYTVGYSIIYFDAGREKCRSTIQRYKWVSTKQTDIASPEQSPEPLQLVSV